jgi:hypothetical protein
MLNSNAPLTSVKRYSSYWSLSARQSYKVSILLCCEYALLILSGLSSLLLLPEDHQELEDQYETTFQVYQQNELQISDDQTSSDSESEDDSSNIRPEPISIELAIRKIRTYTECLQDIGQSLDHPTLDDSDDEAMPLSEIDQRSAEDYHTERLRDNFPTAEMDMLQYHGRMSWQRYQHVQKELERNAQRQNIVIPDENSSVVYSKFIDSGLGTSLPPSDQTTKDVADERWQQWQCTFCLMSLTAKSWRRHEETQHYPKHQWTCLYSGLRIQLPSSSQSVCAFCEIPNPDDKHLQHHRISECLSKAEPERTFGRPDHLHQHARNYHKCERPLSELVRDKWRKDGPSTIRNWTCGFCQEVLLTWDARATHIAAHFRAGMRMTQWRRDTNFGETPVSLLSRDGDPIGDTLYNMQTSPEVGESASLHDLPELS